MSWRVIMSCVRGEERSRQTDRGGTWSCQGARRLCSEWAEARGVSGPCPGGVGQRTGERIYSTHGDDRLHVHPGSGVEEPLHPD